LPGVVEALTRCPERVEFLHLRFGRRSQAGRDSPGKGQAPLKLKALEIPGKTVMDVRQVALTLLELERPGVRCASPQRV
jgi:hypothetical protein